MKTLASVLCFLGLSAVSFGQEAMKTTTSNGQVTPATEEQSAKIRESLPITIVAVKSSSEKYAPQQVNINNSSKPATPEISDTSEVQQTEEPKK